MVRIVCLQMMVRIVCLHNCKSHHVCPQPIMPTCTLTKSMMMSMMMLIMMLIVGIEWQWLVELLG